MKDNITENIKITFEEDCRCFKAGDSVELSLIPQSVNFLVGKNACGKSTLLQAIRKMKDDLREIITDETDGLRSLKDKLPEKVSIEGLDQYERVYCLDATEDHPQSLNNSYTAWSLVAGGGFAASRQNRGRTTMMMLTKFLDRIFRSEKVDGDEVKQYFSGEKKFPKTLLVVDEADEGLDVENQMKYYTFLLNIAKAVNATVLCVTHNPLCMMGSWGRHLYPVFDLEDRKLKLLKEWFEQRTGYSISLDKVQEDTSNDVKTEQN